MKMNGPAKSVFGFAQNQEFLDWLIIIFIAIPCVYFPVTLQIDINDGGDFWNQGDWLINSSAGFSRRFLIGDLILFIARSLNLNPVHVVAVIQIIFFFSLFFTLYLFRNHMHKALFVAFLCAPAFFTMFWTVDHHGALRKEVIIFLSILMQVYAFSRSSLLLLCCSAMLFALAVLSHEALILFVPLILWIDHYYGKRVFNSKQVKLHGFFCLFISVAKISAILVAALVGNTATSNQICDVLIAHNLSPHICLGAIKWLDFNFAYSFKHAINLLWGPEILEQLRIYILCFAPILILITSKANTRHIMRSALLTGLPFLPLYFIAVDWGRWMSYHFFSFFVVVLVFEIVKPTTSFAKLSSSLFLLTIVIQLSVGTPSHVTGVVDGTFNAFVFATQELISAYVDFYVYDLE